MAQNVKKNYFLLEYQDFFVYLWLIILLTYWMLYNI